MRDSGKDSFGVNVHNLDFNFASIPLLYHCMLVLMSLVFMIFGDLYFVYAHLFFLIAAFSVVALFDFTGFGLIKAVRSFDWAAVCLAAFLTYYFIMAFFYPDPEVSAYHMRSLFVRVAPYLTTGFLIFGVFSRPRFARMQDIYAIQKLRNWLDLMAIVTFAATVLVAFIALVPMMQRDYFLISVPHGRAMYQLFGVYVCVIAIAFFYLVFAYGSSRYAENSMNRLSVTVILPLGMLCLLLFLCQLVGSNMGALFVVLFGISLGFYEFWRALFEGTSESRRRAIILLFAGLVAVAVVVGFASIIAPLRIFGFARVGIDALMASSSIASRIEIFKETGLAQIGYAPLFGDLAVERIAATPGHYLHSIISVQTHLGLVGSCLLLSFIMERVWRLYKANGYEVLKISIVPILVISIFAVFFTWPLLWLAIGGLYLVRRPDH